MTDAEESIQLKQELIGLFQYITRVREEIAAISRPADDEHGFESMGDQLDAIVNATDEATNTIMERVESNSQIVNELKQSITDAEQVALLDKIIDNGSASFEACSFQDITGQRVTKVIKSVTYVEEKINALIDIWGKAELEKVEVKSDQNKTDDEKLLHGPQLDKEKSISQAEIDALFD
jgi:chemotaxis protein CheZ